MFEDHNATVYEIISSAELLDREQLDELNDSHLQTGKSLADAVIDSGVVERSAILGAVAAYLGCDYLADMPVTIDSHIASSVNANAKATVSWLYLAVKVSCAVS